MFAYEIGLCVCMLSFVFIGFYLLYLEIKNIKDESNVNKEDKEKKDA